MSQGQVLEGDIAFLITHRDYVKEKLHNALEVGDQAKIRRFNRELGLVSCEIGEKQRMLIEWMERMVDYAQTSK